MSRILQLICVALIVQGAATSAQEAPPFACVDGTEIALASVCDGLPHCPDSSDETTRLCHRVVCPASSFKCAYGACTARANRCNGYSDCVDGSDEYFCDSPAQCGDHKFQCIGSYECISFSQVCDGYQNCADKSDESESICKDYTCPEHAFRCSYGGCVHQEVVCDGVEDCIDGADEEAILCAAANCRGDQCQKYSCGSDEFSCESGNQCVPLSKLCDGTYQCRDASDERAEACKARACPDGYFRCAYGACVPVAQRCNKHPNCHDWSDEDESLCGVNQLPEGACRLPAAQPATRYEVSSCRSSSDIWDRSQKTTICRPGDVVAEFTRLNYSCYGEDVRLEGASSVHCQAGRWLPSTPICSSLSDTEVKCPPVKSPGAIKRCELKWGPEAGWTSCEHPQSIGTAATMECREYYERERGSSRVTCLHDGTWSQAPLSCRPVCGLRMSSSVALIVKGWDAPAEDPLPWHATLFSHENGEWNFFCGGTLIAESVVITAGHCVWKTDPDTIRVLFASNSSDYTSQSAETQVRAVSRIELQSSYQDHEGNYNSDLALIVLDKPVTVNSRVLPACVDWANDYDVAQRVGDIGIVAGMGITENDAYSPTLRLVSAKVISESECRQKETRDFRKYLTYTAFCAGWANGSSVCNGDSGGGFLMPRPGSNVWDIHGIVSLSPRRLGASFCDPNYSTVFTRLSAYVNWIKRIVRSIPVSEVASSGHHLMPNRDDVELD